MFKINQLGEKESMILGVHYTWRLYIYSLREGERGRAKVGAWERTSQTCKLVYDDIIIFLSKHILKPLNNTPCS